MHNQALTPIPAVQRAPLDLAPLEGSIARLVLQCNALRQRVKELHAENDVLRGRALAAEKHLAAVIADAQGVIWGGRA